MKKNNNRKIRLAAALVAVVLFGAGLTGCKSKEKAVNTSKCEFSESGEELTELAGSGEAALLEDGDLRLTMDEKGILKVSDSENEVLWSSGITSANGTAGLNNLGAAVSSAVLNYQINNESDMSLYSGPDSFDKKQFRLYKKEDTLIVEQILGEFTENLLLPEALSESRFSELLDRVDSLDAGFLERQYAYYTPDTARGIENGALYEQVPELRNKPFYVLMNIRSHSARTRIHDVFSEAGYTSEDLAADRREAGITIAEQGTVFKVVMEFSFDQGELVVEIPCDQIFSPENAPLLNIDLFKYGLYTPKDSDGHYMVPSGSGSLFGFSGGKTADYTLQYLGQDYTNIRYNDKVDYSGYPVYGMTNGSKGYLAVIERGAENIRMRIEDAQEGYIMYPQLEVLRSFQTNLGKTRKFNIYSDYSYNQTVSIRYAFLRDEQATYSGMANYYRNYLVKRDTFAGKEVSAELPFGMEIINIIRTTKETAGFEHSAEKAVTTFDSARDIISYFKNNDVSDLHVKLSGANQNGLFIQEPGVFKAGKKAGGTKGYQELLKYCEDEGISSYLNLNLPFNYFDSFFNGYSRNRHTSRLLNNKPATLSYKEKSTFSDRTDLPLIEVVSPYFYEQYAAQYLESKADIGGGVSVGEFSRILNSDFSKERHTPRSKTLENVTKSLKALTGEFSLMGENPGVFALPFIGYGEKIPMTGGEYSIFERSIPFVQMLIHGNLDFTSEYWNNAADRSTMRLKAIETGSGISYRFADAVSTDIMKGPNNFLYNVDFIAHKEAALEDYRYVSQALKGLNRMAIIEHQYLSDTLVRVKYESEQTLYINYADTPAQANGVEINARSYTRVES